jgi:hypothetical protein
LPLASASSLMVKVSANDVEDVASADNRRFWSSSFVPPAEYLNTTNTIKQKELDWAIIPTTDLHTYIGTGYTRVATLTTAGVATWQYFFPFSDTYELKSVMGIVRRLIGQNKNSGEDSASNGGFNNTNSGINSASSGGDQNTNSGAGSASSGGINNTNSGINSASSGGDQNTNSGAGSASSGGSNNTNSGINSASSGGSNNTNSGSGSASSGGDQNANSGLYSASSGGSNNTNSGVLSCVIGGQFYELADDYCFATGYNTSLTPSGANQNLSHYFNAQTGEARHKGTVKIGGNINDGTGAKVVITASSGDIHTKGDLQVNGKIKNAAGANVVFDDGIDVEEDIQVRGKIKNADGADVVFDDGVTIEGGITTVAPPKFVAAYDLTDMRWEVTIDAIGGIIEIPFNNSFPLNGAILKITNPNFGAGSRMYCQPVAVPTLPQGKGFVVNINSDGEMFFHGVGTAIEEAAQVWFDIINPV